MVLIQTIPPPDIVSSTGLYNEMEAGPFMKCPT